MTSLMAGATRAHLPDTDEVYVLGPLEAPLLLLNVTDDQGCAWLVDEPEGWDAPEFVTPMDSRADGHGGFAGITTFPPRLLSFDGLVSCPSPSAARAARRRLLNALSANLAGQILYTQLDDEPAKSLWCKPTGKVRAQIVDGYAVVFAFTLIAENPLKFGTSALYGTARLPSTAGQPGRRYPRVYPVVYGAPVQTLTEIRRNLVPNPRLGVNATGWTANAGTGGTAAVTWVAGQGPAGEGIARATWSVASTAAGSGQLRADGRAATALPIPVTAGRVVSGSMWVRSSIAQRVALQITYFDAAGGQAGIVPTGTAGPAVVLAANTWTQVVLDGATVPAGATHALIGPQAVTGAGSVVWPVGATLDATLGLLEYADVHGAYFDGTTAGTSQIAHTWTGNAHGSASVESSITTAASPSRTDLVQVPNAGDEWADALYRLTGPVPQPRIDLGTGEFVGLLSNLGALDVLEVDTRSGTVRVNGVNRADVLIAGSTFPQIPPGGTTVRLRSQAGGEDPAAGLTVTTAPTWK